MTGSTWLNLLHEVMEAQGLLDAEVTIDNMRGLLAWAESEATRKGRDPLKEVWARQSEIHAETADDYAERSHEVMADLSDSYSAVSEAHRHLSEVLRVKADLPEDPRNSD